MTEVLRIVSLLLVAVSVGGMVYAASLVRVPMAARLGYRGARRRQAVEDGGLFGSVEPLVRYLAGAIALLPLAGLRSSQERDLQRADYCLGLTPDELSALSVISSGVLGAAIAAMTLPFAVSPLVAIFAAVFGLVLPTIQVREVVRGRAKVISRGLPHAIEIAAMCMGAGLDFPGALRQITSGRKGEPDALMRELSVILERLELGHTRKAAFQGFAERVPSPAVRDFVNAVIQAEAKGNPLAQVIQIQGRILNTRRSVAAEEAAARAGVLLIGPMMLLVVCILLLLVGPFMVTGTGF